MPLYPRRKPVLVEPEPATTTEPRNIGDVEAALQAIDAERADIALRQAQFTTRERALLEADADNSAFDKLDDEAKSWSRQLEKLDLREQRLLALARQFAAADRRAEWEADVASYQAAAAAVVSSGRAFAEAATALERLRWKSAERGFTVPGNEPLLPAGPKAVSLDTIVHFERAVASLAHRQPPAAAAPPALFSVRLVKAYDKYNAGETAGFSAATAWDLINRGIAEWAQRPPARPQAPVMPQAGPDGRISVVFKRAWAPAIGRGISSFGTSQPYRLLAGLADEAVRLGVADYVPQGEYDEVR